MLVFDSTQPESFSILQKWLNYLKHIKTLTNAKGISQCRNGMQFNLMIYIGILVATKLDQVHRRAVGQEEAEVFAKANSLAYFETSAIDPNSAEPPFYYVAHTFHERFEDHLSNTEKAVAGL